MNEPPLPFEPTLPSGSVQAGYRIVRRIGGGGFGTVYEAIDLDLDRQVAFKVLRDRRPHVLDRFRDEARLLARIDDAHVVRVHRYGRLASGHPFLVMELFGDGALSAAAPYGCALAPEVAVAAVAQVLLGLDAAHRAGIVHRDVKDANVLVDSASGRVKVCDFGISRSLEPLAGEAPATGSGLVGTIQYMAPERFSGVRDDPRSDLFAVGVVFFRLLTGRRPFDAPGGDTLQIIHKITHEDVAAPADVPYALGQVCAKLLAREPARRYGTARAALDDLQRALGELPPPRAFPLRTAPPAPIDACASTAEAGGGPVLADGDEIDVWGPTGTVSSADRAARPPVAATAGAVPRRMPSERGAPTASRGAFAEHRGAPAAAPDRQAVPPAATSAPDGSRRRRLRRSLVAATGLLALALTWRAARNTSPPEAPGGSAATRGADVRVPSAHAGSRAVATRDTAPPSPGTDERVVAERAAPAATGGEMSPAIAPARTGAHGAAVRGPEPAPAAPATRPPGSPPPTAAPAPPTAAPPRRSAPPPAKRPPRLPAPTALAAEDVPPPASPAPVSVAAGEAPRRAPSRTPVSPDALRSPFVLPTR